MAGGRHPGWPANPPPGGGARGSSTSTFVRQGDFSLFGPVLFYDVVRTARRGRYFVSRCAYLSVLTFILGWMYFLYAMQYPNRPIPLAAEAELGGLFFYVYLSVQF